jgi:hypothetical protein
MNADIHDKDLQPSSAARNYTIICLTALLLVLLVLLGEYDAVWLAPVPFLIGCLGLLRRWSSAPVMLVLVVAALYFGPAWTGLFSRSTLPGPETFRLSDFILCGAVLAYAAAHYRLQGVERSIFPPEPGRPMPQRDKPRSRRVPLMSAASRRSARSVSADEFTLLLLSLPLWAGVAQVCLYVLPSRPLSVGLPLHWWRATASLPLPWWRALVLIWLFGLGWLVVASLLGYWGKRRMGPEEATLLLQETLWHETRREQRRLNRWLAWARLRRHQRKEKP